MSFRRAPGGLLVKLPGSLAFFLHVNIIKCLTDQSAELLAKHLHVAAFRAGLGDTYRIR
jgi:hypothetical protein